MKILILSPYPQSIVDTISRYDDTYIISTERLDPKWLVDEKFDFVICFGYQHIIKEDTLNIVDDRIVNLHISYLPFGRGAHPNFWSHVENYPSGVTIHRIDPGIDTGRILFQKEVFVDPSIHSFSSSSKILMDEIELLFDLKWWSIRKNEIAGVLQDPSRGSFHLYRDLGPMKKYLDLGWDTPIDECVRRIREDKVIHRAFNSHSEEDVPLRKSFSLREIDESDWKVLLEWRNEKITRQNSFDSDLASVSEHKEFIENVVNDPSRTQFILEHNEIPVGTIREDKLGNDEFELSYTISPAYRGKRIGQIMMSLYLIERRGSFLCEVKEGNVPSIKMIEKFGFKLSKTEKGVSSYKLNVS